MNALIIVLISAAAFLLLLFLVYLFLVRTKSRKEAMEKYKNLNYAHRGLHGEGAAENSLTAFRRAVDEGFGVELDVRLTADGELVVFHDSTLKRMVGVDKKVNSLTLAELREYRLADTDDTVPTLREVFDLVDGKIPLLIEIKENTGEYDVTEKLLCELEGYAGPYIVESFNPAALGRFRKKRKDVPLGILSEHFCSQKKNKGKPLYFALQNMLLNVLSVPDFVAYKHSDAHMLAIKLTRSLFGTVSAAWTVRSEKEEQEAKKNGFDCIIFENYIPKSGRADVSKLPVFVK